MTTTSATSSDAFVASLLSWALTYAQGSFPVFPLHSPAKIGLCDCRAGAECSSPAKHPRTANGFKDATTDEFTVRRWWRESPRANVGVAVPSGFVVLDIDGDEGLAALKEAGYEVPTHTPSATTGKGWHYWFTTTIDLPPRANMLPKVDLRGPGSYVVAPPSLHISGRQYAWVLSPTDCEFAPAPEWLVQLATRSGFANGVNEVARHIDVPSVLTGVPEGRRDIELFRAASKLRYADVPYEWALQAILDAAGHCDPPFSPEAARKKVESAYGRYKPSIDLSAGEGNATLLGEDSVRIELSSANGPVEFIFTDMEKTGPSLEAELSVRLLAPGTASETYDQHINILSHSARDSCRRELESIFSFEKGVLAKLLNRAFSEAKRIYLGVDRSKRARELPSPMQIDYVVDDVVLADRPTIIFGAGSASKTWLGMSMLLAVAQGEPWLGRRTQQRNGLLIDYETGDGTVGYRLRRLSQALNLDDIPDNIYHWWSNGIPLPDQTEAIQRCIEQHNIGFAVIDHCGAACGTEPERAESALRFYRTVARWKIPVLAIAHITGDAESNPDLVRRPFGSVYWANGAGMTWYVRREDQEEGADEIEVGLFSRKFNDSTKPRDFGVHIGFDGTAGPISLELASLRDSVELSASRGAKYVIEQALAQPMTVAEIADASGLPADTVKKTLARNSRMFVRLDEGTTFSAQRTAKWARRDTL